MGALLAKPIASTFRVWDLTNIKTVDYLNTLSITNINVYTFANKPIRILPLDTWISDVVRFSFDGWVRQRLTSCYSKGAKVSWFFAISYFTKLIINKNIIFHWSSIEPGLVLPFLKVLNKLGNLKLPYSNINSSVQSNNIEGKNSYKWSVQENYPTYTKDTKPLLYRSLSYTKSTTVLTNIQPLITSIEESEFTQIEDLYNVSGKADITCLLQTELLTSNNFIYFGTHGYINAQNALISIPILMAYERSNEFTGPYFIKGPSFSRSLISISFSLMQIYSNIFNNNIKYFNFKKPYFNLKNDLNNKVSTFSFKIKRSLIFRQPPQYEVSPLLQILNNFIKYDYNS